MIEFLVDKIHDARFMTMLLVYLSTPDYISLLWTHPTGQLMLAGCVIWMSIGIFVMKKMINFDF